MDNIPIRDYIDQRFADQEKAVNAALASSEKAVDKAEKNAEKWREQANEWRGAMTDKDKAYALKADTERIEGEVKKLQLSEAALSGKASTTSLYIGYLLAIAALLIALLK